MSVSLDDENESSTIERNLNEARESTFSGLIVAKRKDEEGNLVLFGYIQSGLEKNNMEDSIVLLTCLRMSKEEFKTISIGCTVSFSGKAIQKSPHGFQHFEGNITNVDTSTIQKNLSLTSSLQKALFSILSPNSRRPSPSSFLPEPLPKKALNQSDYPDNIPYSLKQPSSHRACVFVDWLLKNVGEEKLREGGVIDVAGGRGEIAFELSVLRGIKTLVIDPVPIKVNGSQIRRMKSLNASKADDVDALFHSRVSQVQDVFDDDFLVRHPDHKEFFQQAALIVGMHPDQATGGIAEWALKNGKPFAIVPCCVFSDLFSERKLKDGTTVRTHKDICRWLLEKDEGNAADFLPLIGKNTVVYNFGG